MLKTMPRSWLSWLFYCSNVIFLVIILIIELCKSKTIMKRISLLMTSDRCFPHVVNICCQHIVAEFTDVLLVDDCSTFSVAAPHRDPDVQTFEEAVKRDPIALGRVVVRTVRASGQRRLDFARVIQDGNRQKSFFLGDRVEIVVPELQLLRDVKTRWDSIYFMIRRLRLLRPVCDIYLCLCMFIHLIFFHRLLIIFWLCRRTKTCRSIV
jgi:hypothetical protein